MIKSPQANEVHVHLPLPHSKQRAFIESPAKRKIIRAGRRSGKTVGIGIYAVERFLAGHRVLYGAPTAEQIQRFWVTVTRALGETIDAGVFRKNETEHVIELAGTEQRIRAKTCFNADTLRGDYADELILDEYQLMSEDAWEVVGAPMLLDNNGRCTFIYTPPSLRSRSVTKARDPQHAAKLFKKAKLDTSGRWETFHFSSHDNPHISRAALSELSEDMSEMDIRQEILAEDIDEAPGALWKRETIEAARVSASRLPEVLKLLDIIVVAVDPSTDERGAGDEAGIVVAGREWRQEIEDGEVRRVPHLYVLEDATISGSPLEWANAATSAVARWNADYIVAEANQGGAMVKLTLKGADQSVQVKMVHASRGKQVRAQPISARAEKGRQHHVGAFPKLEDELCLWQPGDASPGRLDACFAAGTLIQTRRGEIPIEQVQIGDYAQTRRGWRRVINAGMTCENAPVFELHLSNGKSLVGTGNHPIWTENRGWIPLNAVVWDDILMAWKERLWFSMASPIVAIQARQSCQPAFIFTATGRAASWGADRCIGINGRQRMALSRRAMIFITGMKTLATMNYPTSNAYLALSTRGDIAAFAPSASGSTWKRFDRWRVNGTPQKRGADGILSTASALRLRSRLLNFIALNAASNLKAVTQGPARASVPVPAFPGSMRLRDVIMKIAAAKSVAASLMSRRARRRDAALVNATGRSVAGRGRVFNLTIEGEHEYFANGVLVHNCVWAGTELLLVPQAPPAKQPRPQPVAVSPQSFAP